MSCFSASVSSADILIADLGVVCFGRLVANVYYTTIFLDRRPSWVIEAPRLLEKFLELWGTADLSLLFLLPEVAGVLSVKCLNFDIWFGCLPNLWVWIEEWGRFLFPLLLFVKCPRLFGICWMLVFYQLLSVCKVKKFCLAIVWQAEVGRLMHLRLGCLDDAATLANDEFTELRWSLKLFFIACIC